MKIAILGFGKQGLSAYRHWLKPGNQISVRDLSESIEVPSGVEPRLGPDYLKGLEQYDLIVRSPIVHPTEIVRANSRAVLEKITTPTNEFFKISPTKNLIGVTGTKGKGTTSALTTHLLTSLGFRAHLGGNFGTSPLDMLEHKIGAEDWVVLELANFQLIDINYSPPLAACLMVVPDHLNWHKDMDEYIGSKQRLFVHQKASDKAIYFADNELSKRVVSVSKAAKIPYFAEPGALVKDGYFVIDGKPICKTSDTNLLGRHNWQNICAAITIVWQISQDAGTIAKSLKNFPGLEHRLELVKEIRGVKYYNDSFASAPDAAIAAIEAILAAKVVIVGGFDRGLPIDHLARSLKESESSIVKALVIGASGERLAKELNRVGFTNYEVLETKDMSDIVNQASKLAESGQAVVLSPGFASFDMFKNFEERGESFRRAVKEL